MLFVPALRPCKTGRIIHQLIVFIRSHPDDTQISLKCSSKWNEAYRLSSERNIWPHRRPLRREILIMRSLYQPDAVDELKRRVALLQPDSPRQWGKMTPGQALAHYSAQLEMILGKT